MNSKIESKIRNRCDAIVNIILKTQPDYYKYKNNSIYSEHLSIVETMIGAAIWYLPQNNELWTGYISEKLYDELRLSNNPKDVKITKDHEYPRKIAARDLFCTDWTKVENKTDYVVKLYYNKFGKYNLVQSAENKTLVKYQKINIFKNPKDSYNRANIKLKKINIEILNELKNKDLSG